MSFFDKYINQLIQGKKKVDVDLESISAVFNIKLSNLIIGRLRFDGSTWEFEYSSEFKNSDGVHRLVGFPDRNKVYQSETLWPFFKIRIPSIKQPAVRDIIMSENIDSENEGALLTRFGASTMSNPYVLEKIEA